MYRIYLTTQRDGLDFNLAYIGNDFSYAAEHGGFDTAFMNALFAYGYELGESCYPWKKLPPGLETGWGAEQPSAP